MHQSFQSQRLGLHDAQSVQRIFLAPRSVQATFRATVQAVTARGEITNKCAPFTRLFVEKQMGGDIVAQLAVAIIE